MGFEIQNRRYLGSKARLLDFIDSVVSENCKNCLSFADLFGGTGVVTSHFKSRFSIVVNDSLYANYIAYVAFFSKEEFDENKLADYIGDYNALNPDDIASNYYSLNFSDTYFSEDNLKIIGKVRNDIESKYNQHEINYREYCILITCLIYSLDRMANTVGHYESYMKEPRANFSNQIRFKLLSIDDSPSNITAKNMDANELVKELKVDIAYIDPPYNTRQYIDLYHFIENIARHKEPKVSGITKKMDTDDLKSLYCTNKARFAFEDLVKNINAKYILVSYNNLGNKTYFRSNAKITDSDILRILQSKGRVRVFTQGYRAYNAGKTNISHHRERLFLCEVGVFDKKPYKEPENYVPAQKISEIQPLISYPYSKISLIGKIKEYLPKTDVFYDLFSGGLGISINHFARVMKAVEIEPAVIALLQYLKVTDYPVIYQDIMDLIECYGFSNTALNGYEYYGTNNNNGVGRYNKKAFINLTHDFNDTKDPKLLLLLIIFGFNNQIQFDIHNDFLGSVGKRDFTLAMQNKLQSFVVVLKSKRIDLICSDFREIELNSIAKQHGFIFADPPYFSFVIPQKTRPKWKPSDHHDLMEYLDRCNQKNIRFALLCTLDDSELSEGVIYDWIKKSGYNCLILKTHRGMSDTLIINY